MTTAECFALTGAVTCRVETEAAMVALTLDDGPTPAGTEHALAILEGNGGRATFFLSGPSLERHPGLAGRIVAEGHEVANHGYAHRPMVGRSIASYEADIARTAAALRREGGRGPLLFRPPYGIKLFGLPRATERQGHRMVMWDVKEPNLNDPRAYARDIVHRARPGSIILMHVMHEHDQVARDALPLVLQGLRERGFRTVTVGQLLAAEKP